MVKTLKEEDFSYDYEEVNSSKERIPTLQNVSGINLGSYEEDEEYEWEEYYD